MSLPRVLSLDADGALIMRLAPAAAKLRGKAFTLPASTTPPAERLRALREFRIENIAAEISLRVRPVAFSMGLTDGQQMFFKITYDPAKTGGELSANGAAAALSVGKDQEVAITLVIHGSVVECFANGKTCLTTRVYRIPAGPLSVDVPEPGLRNVVSLQAWQMTPVSPDRLTT